MKSNDFAAAVDIGGTKIDLGIINRFGKIIYSERIPTPSKAKFSANKLTELIAQTITLQSEKYHSPISSIGIGIAGQVDKNSSKLINGPNIRHLQNLDFKVKFKQLLDVPCVVENDARCFAYSQAIIGQGKSYSRVFGVTIGTGIGGGLIEDGVIIKGSHQGFGEIGHTLFIADGLLCGCGAKGCLEQYCSASALVKMGIKSLKMPDLTGPVLSSLYKNEKNRKVAEIYEKFANNLGIGLASAANLLDPQIIILGGSVIESFSLFEKHLRYGYDSYALPGVRDIPIIASNTVHSAMVGAGLLSFKLSDVA